MVTISKFVILVSLLPTIIVTMQFEDGKTVVGQKVTVFVTNNMTSYQLGVDCKDKNYDFGFRTLHFAESYVFSFVPSFIISSVP